MSPIMSEAAEVRGRALLWVADVVSPLFITSGFICSVNVHVKEGQRDTLKVEAVQATVHVGAQQPCMRARD